MPPKRLQSTNLRLADYEKEKIRKMVDDWGESESDIIRACLAIGLPVLESCPLLRRLRLEDNKDFEEMQ